MKVASAEHNKWSHELFALARETIDMASDNFTDEELRFINGDMDGGEDMGALLTMMDWLPLHDDAHWEDLVPNLVKYANGLRNTEEIAQFQEALDTLFEAKGKNAS